MKRIFIAAMMLMVMSQSVWSQSNEDYSLKGLSQTLKKLQVTSLGDFNNGHAIIIAKNGEENLFGVINKQGKLVIPCEYNHISKEDISENLIVLYSRDKYAYGYFDVNGQCIIPFQYVRAEPFSEGLAAVQTKEDEKTYSWRYIDKQGNTVISPIMGVDKAGTFQDGIACLSGYDRVNDCEGTKIINKQGNVVSEKPYRNRGYSNGFFLVRNEKKGSEYRKYGVMNKSGVMIVPTQYKGVGFPSDDLIAVQNQLDKIGYIDMEGRVKIDFQFDDVRDFSDGIAPIKQNGKFGLIDKEGKIIIPCRYEDALDFSEGLAAVCENKKWGFIDREGKIQIPIIYDRVKLFHEGYAVAIVNNQVGMIDKDGKIFIPFGMFDEISSFSEGVAKVKKNGMYGFVDKDGMNTFGINIPKPNNVQSSAERISIEDVMKVAEEMIIEGNSFKGFKAPSTVQNIMKKYGYKMEKSYYVYRAFNFQPLYYKNCSFAESWIENNSVNYSEVPSAEAKGVPSFIGIDSETLYIAPFTMSAFEDYLKQIKDIGATLIEEDESVCEFKLNSYTILAYKQGVMGIDYAISISR